ncbi:MAG: Asp-tRNA(Asn)/Glu-tRNA(Gln) amidotransferase subunit GatA [Gammaproteobacteria bacterium AqS3]|nr:Asp-tRNA(Asn)/Glu-tRNA(Gln) amidotransferase subunit GatA [Gammaproteobacteria bacterium AqS3]
MQLARSLRQGETTSEALTEAALTRARAAQDDLNAFVTLCPDEALAEARSVDAERAAGAALGPLAGVPMAHKDLFCTEGIRTTCGSRMLDNFIPPYDAHVVERVKAARMPVIGKLNMDEFAMGSSNENSYYGAVHNPWDLRCSPGGSSGGSAAAVAAGIVPGATGTDTGGSIRQPAALCNLLGIKPSYGRVSRYGMVAFASSLDQGGVLTRNAEDAAALLQVIAGHDARDATCINAPVPDYLAELRTPLEGVRIGLPDFGDGHAIAPAYRELLEACIEQLRSLGAETVSVQLPNADLGIAIYYVIAPAEASANLARYDGVHYGHRCENPADLQDLYRRSRSEGFGEEVRRRIMVGAHVLARGFYDAYYLQAQKCRRLVLRDYQSAFTRCDVILTPTVRAPAFRLGEKLTDDPTDLYLEDLYTVGANLAGLPGLSMPVGFVDGLPVGVQLIGRALEEGRILSLAHRYQQHTDWHLRTPPGFSGDGA